MSVALVTSAGAKLPCPHAPRLIEVAAKAVIPNFHLFDISHLRFPTHASSTYTGCGLLALSLFPESWYTSRRVCVRGGPLVAPEICMTPKATPSNSGDPLATTSDPRRFASSIHKAAGTERSLRRRLIFLCGYCSKATASSCLVLWPRRVLPCWYWTPSWVWPSRPSLLSGARSPLRLLRLRRVGC